MMDPVHDDCDTVMTEVQPNKCILYTIIITNNFKRGNFR